MLRPKEVSRHQSDKQGRELWSACKDLEAARSLEHSRKSRKMFKAEEGHDQNLSCVSVCGGGGGGPALKNPPAMQEMQVGKIPGEGNSYKL